MKSLFATGAVLTLTLAVGSARAQSGPYSPSLLPLPQTPSWQASAPAWSGAGWSAPARTAHLAATPDGPMPAEALPSPSDQPAPTGPSLGHEYGPAPQHYYSPSPEPYPEHSYGGDAGGQPYVHGEGGWDGMSDAYGAACGETCGEACGYSPGSPWFGGAYGLIMTRTGGSAEFFSYYNSNEADQLLDARKTNVWGGGFEVMLGRCLCDGWAISGSYFGLFPGTAEDFLYDPPGAVTLNTVYDINAAVQYDNGGGLNPIINFFDGALAHRLQRTYQVHNVELNLLHQVRGLGQGPCHQPRAYVTLLGGVRWFQLQDGFNFASDSTDGVFNGDADEVFYRVRMTNNLVGFQIGGMTEYFVTSRLSLVGGARIGLYGNYISGSSFLGGPNGAAVITAGPNAGRSWDIHTNKTVVSFLGEISLGANFQLTDRWSVSGGYRVITGTGLALATDQIPRDFRGVNDVERMNTNGSLILHGAWAGVEYNW